MQHVHRLLRLVVHQIDRGQLGGDFRLGDAVQPFVHLIGEKIGRRAQQIHRHQPVRHAPDHLVAIRADRGEVDIVIEHRQAFHRRQLVGAAFEVKIGEGRAHVVLGGTGASSPEKFCGGDTQGLETRFAISSARNTARRACAAVCISSPIAAPAEAQPLQYLDACPSA